MLTVIRLEEQEISFVFKDDDHETEQSKVNRDDSLFEYTGFACRLATNLQKEG